MIRKPEPKYGWQPSQDDEPITEEEQERVSELVRQAIRKAVKEDARSRYEYPYD